MVQIPMSKPNLDAKAAAAMRAMEARGAQGVDGAGGAMAAAMCYNEGRDVHMMVGIPTDFLTPHAIS